MTPGPCQADEALPLVQSSPKVQAALRAVVREVKAMPPGAFRQLIEAREPGPLAQAFAEVGAILPGKE